MLFSQTVREIKLAESKTKQMCLPVRRRHPCTWQPCNPAVVSFHLQQPIVPPSNHQVTLQTFQMAAAAVFSEPGGLAFAFCSCAMPHWTATCSLINHSAIIQRRHRWSCPACYSEHQVEMTRSESALLKSILVWICSLASCEWCRFFNLNSVVALIFSNSSLESHCLVSCLSASGEWRQMRACAPVPITCTQPGTQTNDDWSGVNKLHSAERWCPFTQPSWE